MANELQIQAVVTFAKGTIASLARASGSINRDVTGSRCKLDVQAVGTTIEALALGDIGTLGYCYMKNLDQTNFILVYPSVTDPAMIKLKPGDVAMFRVAAAAPAVKADTLSCDLEYMLISD